MKVTGAPDSCAQVRQQQPGAVTSPEASLGCYGLALDTAPGTGWGQPRCCPVHTGMEQEGTGKDAPGIVSLPQTISPAWSSAALLRLQQQDLGRKGNCLHGAGGCRVSQACSSTEIPGASSGQPLALAVGHQRVPAASRTCSTPGNIPKGGQGAPGCCQPGRRVRGRGQAGAAAQPRGAGGQEEDERPKAREMSPCAWRAFPAGREHWHIFRRFVLPVNPSVRASAVD